VTGVGERKGIGLGLLLPTSEPARQGTGTGPVVSLAREAEDAGVDSLWVGDSLFARPRLDPLLTLAAVAAATSRVRLGTAVLVAPMWNPLVLARSIATLDHAAGGRLVLGVGAGPAYGPAKKEFAALGIPFEGRLSRLVEIVEICRTLWSDESASYAGKLWDFQRVNLLPKPVQEGGPPLWLGGAGPRTLRTAGRMFDGWLPVVRSVSEMRSGLGDVRTAAIEAGRPPDSVSCGAYVTLVVDEDETRARAIMRTYLEDYYGGPWEHVRDLQDFYAGGAEGAAEWLRAYVVAGARDVVIRFAGPDPVAQLRRIQPWFAQLRLEV
jgi:probable F420-dependent oxidoreductase